MVLSLLLFACVSPLDRLPPIPQPARVPYGDPARDAQSRLLQEAHRAFAQERYRAAALFFYRYADDAPDSPRLAEARWWLGRAYEQIGDYRAAMEQYRTIAAGMESEQQDGTLYEGHALRRLDELRQTHAEQRSGRSIQLALRLRIGQLPPLPALSSWFEELAQAGATALVIDLESVPTSGRTGGDVEIIRAGAAEAHRHGLLLWVGVDLHRGMGREVKPEWTVRRCRGMAEDGGGEAPLDVTNPAYQASVEEMVRMLSGAGIDGLVLAARSTDGFADECSEASVQGFARSLGRELTSESLSGTVVAPGDGIQERPAQYWRWAGWKARSYVQWVARLRKVLRAARPTATLLTEIHSATLAAPLQGLEQFGEDVVELTAHTGGWIVVRDAEAVDGQTLDRLHRQIGSGGRVWVERTVNVAQARRVVTAVHALMAGAGRDRWNVLIRVESGGGLP
jgi:hypothetical protein